MRFTVVINGAGARDPRLLLHGSVLVSSGKLRRQPAAPTSRRKKAAAASCRRGSPGSSRPSRSRSGSTWRSRSCRWPPRSRMTRRATSRGRLIWGLVDARRSPAWARCFLNTGRRRRSRDHRHVGDAAVRRVQGGLRGGHGGRAARADRADGPDRQLLHHHLRLRPQHLLAVAGGLLPAVACRSPTRPGTRRTSR